MVGNVGPHQRRHCDTTRSAIIHIDLLLCLRFLQVLTRPLVQEGEEAIPRIISNMQVSKHAKLITTVTMLLD
jgi:hypothetical protein